MAFCRRGISHEVGEEEKASCVAGECGRLADEIECAHEEVVVSALIL